MADCNVPAGQFNRTLPVKDWMVKLAGGLTVTIVAAGADVQLPVAAVTLISPDALVDAFTIGKGSERGS